MMAGILGGRSESAPENILIVSDIVPLSVSVEITRNRVKKMIKATSAMPCEKEETFLTSVDNQ